MAEGLIPRLVGLRWRVYCLTKTSTIISTGAGAGVPSEFGLFSDENGEKTKAGGFVSEDASTAVEIRNGPILDSDGLLPYQDFFMVVSNRRWHRRRLLQPLLWRKVLVTTLCENQ